MISDAWPITTQRSIPTPFQQAQGLCMAIVFTRKEPFSRFVSLPQSQAWLDYICPLQYCPRHRRRHGHTRCLLAPSLRRADHWVHEERHCGATGEQPSEPTGFHGAGGRDGHAAMIYCELSFSVLTLRFSLSWYPGPDGILQRMWIFLLPRFREGLAAIVNGAIFEMFLLGPVIEQLGTCCLITNVGGGEEFLLCTAFCLASRRPMQEKKAGTPKTNPRHSATVRVVEHNKLSTETTLLLSLDFELRQDPSGIVRCVLCIQPREHRGRETMTPRCCWKAFLSVVEAALLAAYRNHA